MKDTMYVHMYCYVVILEREKTLSKRGMIVYHVATELVVEKMSGHMSGKQIEQNSTVGTLMGIRIRTLVHTMNKYGKGE